MIINSRCTGRQDQAGATRRQRRRRGGQVQIRSQGSTMMYLLPTTYGVHGCAIGLIGRILGTQYTVYCLHPSQLNSHASWLFWLGRAVSKVAMAPASETGPGRHSGQAQGADWSVLG